MLSSPNASATASKILSDARWMACRTQAEVAERAGVTQQMIAMYESGKRQPSVATLTRLVAGCGMQLTWQLVPEAGFDDESTLDLLALEPLERLPPAIAACLLALVAAKRQFDFLVGGKTAARMHGAALDVYEVELWVDERIDLDDLEAFLRRTGVQYFSPSGSVSPPVPGREQLLRGWQLIAPGSDLEVRSMSRFAWLTGSATEISLPDGGNLLVVSTDECANGWRRRDLDHLQLQRAVRLMGQRQG